MFEGRPFRAGCPEELCFIMLVSKPRHVALGFHPQGPSLLYERLQRLAPFRPIGFEPIPRYVADVLRKSVGKAVSKIDKAARFNSPDGLADGPKILRA